MAAAAFRGTLAEIFREAGHTEDAGDDARQHPNARRIPMAMSRLLGVVALTSVLALPLVGCSSSGGSKISSRRLCESAGGVYSGNTCNPGSSKKAAEMCAANGGIYLDGEDTCRMPVGNL
jgi:hypothetical protein